MKATPDTKSINPFYRGLSIGDIARAVFRPKHDRVPIEKPEKKKSRDSRERSR